MQISNTGVQSNMTEWVKKTSVEESVKRENAKKADKVGKTASDYVSISANAGNSSEALVRARANALPEVREERVALAKERIESGHYNTEDFSKELAERLVEG
jgi:anti-sigma28 factor (negative regulator of flagellin synthesis)